MKWFNHKEFFVVVLEDGDTYGPDSRRTYNLSEPTVRLFDRTHRYRNQEDYPLLAEWSLSALKRAGSSGDVTKLANGQSLETGDLRELYKFTNTLLVNSGALSGSQERMAA